MQLTSDDTLAEEAEEEDDEKLVWQSRRRSGSCAKAPHVFVIFPDTAITIISTFPEKKRKNVRVVPSCTSLPKPAFPCIVIIYIYINSKFIILFVIFLYNTKETVKSHTL